MSSLPLKRFSSLAVEVNITSDMLEVHLADGRIVSVPLEWYPSLRDASEEERNNWRLIGGGVGIHWEAIDEDLSVEGLLN